MSCARPFVDATRDFGATGGSARACLERLGLLDSVLRPTPQLAPQQLKVHSIPLKPPYPHPSSLTGRISDGTTLEWPHPDLAAEDLD